jgi:hypothetical protein
MAQVKSNVGETTPGKRRGFMADRSFRGGGSRYHAGVDYFGKAGDAVSASEDGVVIKAQRHGGYNGTIDVLHTSPDGSQYVTRYGHLQDKYNVRVGDKVSAGQTMGALDGDNHLHMEVRDYEKYKKSPFARPSPGMSREEAEGLGLYDTADYFAGKGRFGHLSVNPTAVVPEPATTGSIQPTPSDPGSMQPVVAPVENAKVPASAPPTPAPSPTPMSETGSAVPSPDSPHGRMSQEQLYARFSEDEKSALKATDTSKDKMAGIRYWQEKAAKYDSGQNAAPVQSAPQAPAKPQEAPKEVEKPADTNTPAMKTGGRVRASGEDFSIVDNESQRKLGDVNRGENINFKDTGHVQVTPEHRVDPRELEDKRATRQDNAEAQAKARTLSQETHAQVNQMLNQPQSSNFPQTEQWGHRSTPASFHRAVEASKGRKNSGSFAGSRFGEEQLSNLS